MDTDTGFQCDDCTVNEGGEVLDATIQDQQFTNSYCQNDECYSSFRLSESDGIGAAADQCNPGEHCYNSS